MQTVKKCMYKCDHSGHDIDLALLSLRSTPLDSHVPSPAELLNGRKYRTTMPIIDTNVAPIDNNKVRFQLEQRQQKSKQQYDKHTKEKIELDDNQPVRIRNQETRRWEPANVITKAGTPRSYIVQRCSGGIPLRRNRQQLRPTHEQWRIGEYVNNDQLEDVEFDEGEQRTDTREMVGSEPSLSSSVSSPHIRETVDSELSPRYTEDVAREDVGRGDVGREEGTVDGQRRYPTRTRNRPDFYQCGS